MSKVSAACCSIPPVVDDVDSYQLKGSYTTVSDYKTYTTGDSNASRGLLVIYDIFGFFPQTQQGADIIASSGSKPFVVMPDLFKGEPMDIKNFPPDNEEKKQKLGAFFGGPAAPPTNVANIKKLLPGLKEKFPAVKEWVILGYCWGGKIATLLAGPESPFVASIQLHPAMLDPEDGKKLTAPHLCIATGDEDKGDVEKFRENVSGESKSKVEYWGGTFHGFMAARANLKDKENYEYYTKGYQVVVDWLKAL